MPRPEAASATARAARFAAALAFDDLPPSVAEKVKLHVLDAVGCGLAGADSTLTAQVLAFLGEEHAAGPCPVLGTGLGFGPATAAFANATAINALDFDDGFEVEGTGMGHPGASIVAAALAMAGVRPTPGTAFLAAVAAGYEINGRLIHAMQPSPERFGEVYGVGQHQAIGAAVACGRIAGLDADAMENALGFAGTLANVPSLRKYNWERRPLVSFKDFVAPAAEAGVRAVRLHAAGLVGAKAVLDGASGLWRMLGSDRFDDVAFAAGLGETWRLAKSAFKPYPACRWMHATLEAFETLLAGLDANDVEAVTVHGSAALCRDFMDPAPATMVDAQFSLPFALAALAYRLQPARAWYLPATLARADLRAFGARVSAEFDPEVDRAMAGPQRRPAGRVTVTAHGKHRRSPLLALPKGGAERPLDATEVHAKFLGNATPVLGGQPAERLLERFSNLEAEADVGALVDRCRRIRP